MNDVQILKAQIAEPQGLSAMQLLIIAVVIVAIIVWVFRSRNKNKSKRQSNQKQIDRSSLSSIESDSKFRTKENVRIEELGAKEKYKSSDLIHDKIPIQQHPPQHMASSEEHQETPIINAQLKKSVLEHVEMWSTSVAKGKHEEVIEKVIAFTKVNNLKKYHRESITLSSRYKSLMNGYNKGILKSEDVFLETNKINDALINLLYAMERECL